MSDEARKFCGKCSAGYIYRPGDDFVGRRCECNPRPDDRPEGGIGATTLDPRLAIVLSEGDGGTWTVAALAGLATNLYPKLASMLRRLEWADSYGCPVCQGARDEGHILPCDLATLLRELP